MAIFAYTGLMGSGKSYEVVVNVIVPAIAAGRRVVTNVAGLQLDEIYAYCKEVLHAETLGEVVPFVADDLEKMRDFFPVKPEGGDVVPGAVVQPGDVTVVDEVWRFWPAGGRVSAQHMEFMRMHRHFVGAAGLSCELVVICQDIGDLARPLKVVIEKTFRMKKHTALGSDKRYRVDVFQGYRVRGEPLQQYQRAYDPAIFALYSSYSASQTGGGKETRVDKRGNVLHGALIRIGLPLALLAIVGGVVATVLLLKRMSKKDTKGEAATVAAAPGQAVPAQAAPTEKRESEQRDGGRRAVGWFKVGNGPQIVLIEDDDDTKRLQVLISPRDWYIGRERWGGRVDGKMVMDTGGRVRPGAGGGNAGVGGGNQALKPSFR